MFRHAFNFLQICGIRVLSNMVTKIRILSTPVQCTCLRSTLATTDSYLYEAVRNKASLFRKRTSWGKKDVIHGKARCKTQPLTAVNAL